MRELEVKPREEIDLVVKWLGPNFPKHALTLKMANISNPERGFAAIWNRLEERFGAAEMVESALMRFVPDIETNVIFCGSVF
jgi:hypothetical protein